MNRKISQHFPRYQWKEETPRNDPAVGLQQSIERILSAQKLLPTFQESIHFHVQIEVSGHLPLSVSKMENNVTVANYFVEDGEWRLDPAVEMEIGKDRSWYTFTIYLAEDYHSCAAGPSAIDFKKRKMQVAFTEKWNADLLEAPYDQGEWYELVAEH
jgi:hypothetical protein